jgi:LacI family gluconate utilization system Gnt-I transcriptional repressor
MRATRTRRTSRVRMVEVARQAGVAPVTVSRVLHTPDKVAPETRVRVEGVIRELGYVPNLVAQSLVVARTGIVAALIPTIDNSLHAEIIQAMNERCRAARLHLLLGCTNFSVEEEEEMVRSFLARQPEAVYLTGITHSAATRTMLVASGLPVVEVANLPSEPIDMAAGYSSLRAAGAMMRQLIATGRRRIAYVHSPIGANDRLADRLRGYGSALEAAGLAADPAQIVETELSIGGGAAGLRTLLERQVEVDAIFCSTDVLAVGVLLECQRCGLSVPAQVAVAGFDDLPIAGEIVPALTTVRIPRRRMGEEAARLILTRLEGGEPDQPVVDVGFEIVRRASA